MADQVKLTLAVEAKDNMCYDIGAADRANKAAARQARRRDSMGS